MTMHPRAGVVVGIMGIIVVLATCVSLPLHLFSQGRLDQERRRAGALYHDEDGVTTRDAQVAFEKRVKRRLAAIFLLTIAALVCQVAEVAMTTVEGVDRLSWPLVNLTILAPVSRGNP